MKIIQKHLDEKQFKQKRSSLSPQDNSLISPNKCVNKGSTYDKLSNSLKKIKDKICAMALEKNEEKKKQFQEKPNILPKSRELAKTNGPLYSAQRLKEVKKNHSIKCHKIKQSIDFEQNLKEKRELTPIVKRKLNKKSLSLCFDPEKVQTLIYSPKSAVSTKKIQDQKIELFNPKIDKNSIKIVAEVNKLAIKFY